MFEDFYLAFINFLIILTASIVFWISIRKTRLDLKKWLYGYLIYTFALFLDIFKYLSNAFFMFFFLSTVFSAIAIFLFCIAAIQQYRTTFSIPKTDILSSFALFIALFSIFFFFMIPFENPSILLYFILIFMIAGFVFISVRLMFKIYKVQGTPTHQFTFYALIISEFYAVSLILRDIGVEVFLTITQIIGVVLRTMLLAAALVVKLEIRMKEEQRHLEQEMIRRQKLESLSLLAGGIAHDFNNILMSILGNINLIQSEPDLNPEIQEGLKSMENGTLRAKRISNQLLTFSKGGTPIRKTVPIEPLLRDSLEFATRGSNCLTDFKIDLDLPPIYVDEGQISQVLHNLIINAIQAMPDGGKITLIARVANQDEIMRYNLPKPKYIQIIVKDSGKGISKENQEKVFSPYFTTKQGGNGLGLALSYSIVQKHDGLITFQSEINEGTIFIIFLPISTDIHPILPENHNDQDVLLKGNVLLMDDNENILTVLINMCKKIGLDVFIAKNGQELVAKFEELRKMSISIDLIITDLVVPGGIGGLEAFEMIRKIDPKVKTIVSSGFADNPILADFRKYGFKAALKKPYSYQELRAVIKQILE